MDGATGRALAAKPEAEQGGEADGRPEAGLGSISSTPQEQGETAVSTEKSGAASARAPEPAAPPHWGSTSYRLDSRWGRFRAWFNMFFVDHGVFRYVYLNLYRIDKQAFRSAQPGPRHFRRIARKGVRTVVNLRGGRQFGSYPLEREACAAQELAYDEITLRSREAPAVETLRQVAALLDRIAYPALFHCKSGADRAGLMSALYLILKQGLSAAEAKKALSIRYGHFRQSKTGVLDAFLDAFDAAQRDAAAKGERLELLDWAETAYDPSAMTKAFRTKPWADWLVDGVLRRE